MATKAQMETLTRKHQELEAAISAETKHPAFNELRVIELKRKKLLIKDRLEEMRVDDLAPN
ncbi:MAG: hypothetical protein DHS20C05_07410 [Hyphococcus sp.]|nr:MAG: hypothetical protein DHS20C05_07410 [Marinicaulis sp.]